MQTAGSASGTWGAGGVTGDDLNTGVMGLVDTQLAGVVSNSVSSSNVSLSYANIQCCMFRFTGTLLANIVASPAVGDAATYFNGFYYFENVTSGSFTITLTTGAGSVVLPQGRRGCVFVDATNGPRIVSLVGSSTADPVPAGSSTLFYNTTAPSGWTASSLGTSYAVKAVDSGGGGVASGSVSYDTLFARTATDSFTLTLNEIPAHSHTSNAGALRTVGASGAAEVPVFTAGTATSTVGSGNGHTHAIDMRVRTLAFVLSVRN